MSQQGADNLNRKPLLSSFDLAGIAELIKCGKARRIIVACGAGISVTAGIPDFRSPGTGLYSQLAKYNLPYPEAIFDLHHFYCNPQPFYTLAKELFPGKYQPTASHLFIKLLSDKGLLLRCFTQNIDSLESAAGLPATKVVAAHGNFDTAHCTECSRSHSIQDLKNHIYAGKILKCICGGFVKPGIVFFGEELPQDFTERSDSDLPQADLLIVMGTSLTVHPFAGLVGMVSPSTPRLLINREMVGKEFFELQPGHNTRDAVFLGDCDEGARQLASLLGWSKELQALEDRVQGEVPTGGKSFMCCRCS